MSERIKIEDMTLGQIKDLKKEISKEINDYLNRVVDLVDKKFDVGEIHLHIFSRYYPKFDESGKIITRSEKLGYDVSVTFSRE